MRIVVLALFLTGCVTISRHRQELDEAKRAEINFAITLATQVQDDEISARDMIWILKGR